MRPRFRFSARLPQGAGSFLAGLGIALVFLFAVPLDQRLPLGLHEQHLWQNLIAGPQLARPFPVSPLLPTGPRFLESTLAVGSISPWEMRQRRLFVTLIVLALLFVVRPVLALIFLCLPGFLLYAPLAGTGLACLGLASALPLSLFSRSLPSALLFCLLVAGIRPSIHSAGGFWSQLSPWILPTGFSLSGLIWLIVLSLALPRNESPLPRSSLLPGGLFLALAGLLLFQFSASSPALILLLTSLLWLAAAGLEASRPRVRRTLTLLLLAVCLLECHAASPVPYWDDRDHEFAAVARVLPVAPVPLLVPDWSAALFGQLLPGRPIEAYGLGTEGVTLQAVPAEKLLLLLPREDRETLQGLFPQAARQPQDCVGHWEIWLLSPPASGGKR